jgi:hypothetical protein
MNDNLKCALHYAALGYRVYPVWGIKDGKCLCGKTDGCKPGKHPYGLAVPHGGQDATTDEAKIKAWFKGRLVNVGIRIEGFCTLDVENRNGGMELLASWERQHGKMPLTPTAISGSGGRHFSFKPHPAISRLKEKIKFISGAELLVGGDVIVPPSNHVSGGQYSWLLPLETPLAEMPDWLVELVSVHQRTEKQKTVKPTNEESFDPMVMTVSAGNTFTQLGKLPSGSRHDAVNRAIGSMLANGYSREQILEQGIKWAEEQDPPYDIRQLEHKVEDFARKEAVKIEERQTDGLLVNHENLIRPFANSPLATTAEPSEPDNKPTPVELHSRLPEAAYSGLLGEYLKAVEPLTEADPAGILACMLTGIGNAIGRKLHHTIGKRHSGNLFILLVGSTSSRKGTCWSVAESLLSLSCPDWYAACLENGFGSGQGLIHRIRDAQGEDAGIPDKRLLVIEEEFSKPLRLCRNETSILAANIRYAFDGIPLSVLNKGENRYGCREPHISTINMITPEELKELTKGRTELVNGTINRFLLVECRRRRYLPTGGDYLAVGRQFSSRLKAAIESAITDNPLSLDADATEYWNTEYRRLEQERSGDYGKAVARLSVHCLKVAMIYAALDGSPVIRLPHLKAALAFIDYCDRSAFSVFGKPTNDRPPNGPTDEPPHSKLYNFIQSRPNGITKTDAHRLFNNRMSSEDLNKLFDILLSAKLIVQMDNRWYAATLLTGVGGCSVIPSAVPTAEPLANDAKCESANGKADERHFEKSPKDGLPKCDVLNSQVRTSADAPMSKPACSQFADSQFSDPCNKPHNPTPVTQPAVPTERGLV